LIKNRNMCVTSTYETCSFLAFKDDTKSS